jgi:hypothetical protein
MSKPTVLVTGDIVLDCHLYGGVKTAATSFSEPGTVYSQDLGGAVLTRRLLHAASEADGAAYDVCLALDAAGLETTLPPHLRSYGVWTDRPAKRGAKDRVWRSTSPFGYGSTEPAKQSDVYVRVPTAPEGEVPFTVIDDGAILFRHGAASGAWPGFAEERPESAPGAKRWFLLKMSWPLCRGDLWAALAPVMGRLIVVVSAGDLRREDVQINPRLSWEQCVEDTIRALHRDPIAGDLLNAAHVIISYESEGALWYERGEGRRASIWRLLFSHDTLEGDHASQLEGTTYGFQTALAAGIAHRLMMRHAGANGVPAASPFGNPQTMRAALGEGIAGGLATKRLLLELGHGPVGGKQPPGVPVAQLGRCAADAPKKAGGFIQVEVPDTVCHPSGCQWTILQRSETGVAMPASSAQPLTGLAQLTALYGASALSHLPALRMGPLVTVDRSEIESLRTLEALIAKYEGAGVQGKPLSIGVFGPPGAGKSFGVKALAKALLGEKSEFLEFNLSQFKGPDELIGAFHRVRDAVLRGTTPVAFWDEFDAQQYRWLQYLLAPMQDGAFQEGQVTHPIGKCVFIFAGGTSPALEEFGVAKPDPIDEHALADLDPADRTERRRVHREQVERYREFVLLKGPDFLSRLHGFLNVLGPNPRVGAACPDLTWPIRRALILRGILRLKDSDILDVDLGLLNALLAVPTYRHGARSFEKIVTALSQGRAFGRLNRSALPPSALLGLETDAAAFHALLTAADAFKRLPDLEALAAAIHHHFLSQAEKSKLAAEAESNPAKAWVIHPSIVKSYDALDADAKASNRAAARRIPDHLALIGYTVESRQDGDTLDWQKPLTAAITAHVERLAQAEHLGWWAERRANGWTYAKDRDNASKRHHLLVGWSALSQTDQDKDRSFVVAIPNLLVVAGFKALPVKASV